MYSYYQHGFTIWGFSIQNQKAKEMQEMHTRLGLTALSTAYSSLMYHHHSREMSQGLHHDWNHNIHDSHGTLFIQSTKIKIK